MPANPLCELPRALSNALAVHGESAPPDDIAGARAPDLSTAARAPALPAVARPPAVHAPAASPQGVGASGQRAEALARSSGTHTPMVAAADLLETAESVAGYAASGPTSTASKTTAAKNTAPKSAAKSAKASGSTSGEWGFLNDKGLSLEEKLFRFMKKVMQKSDAEIEKKLEEYKARFTASSGSTASGSKTAPAESKPKSSSPFDLLKSIVPGFSAIEKALGSGAIEKLASSLGGPLLAGLATAFGLPELAPVALKVGGDVAAFAVKQAGGAVKPGSSSTSAKAQAGTGAGSGSSEAGSPDEKMAMFELQRLVEKQQQMFAALSNTMKAMHDTQMGVIRNFC